MPTPGALLPPPVNRPGGPARSFTYRRGRITPGQARALNTQWGRYGLDVTAGPLDARAVFGRYAPLVLEIGFGMGESTHELARRDPARDVLAVDVHTPGAGALLRALAADGLSNVRVLIGDGRDVLEHMIPPASLDEVRVFFPDPWPKHRHHGRRLVATPFVRLVAERLAPGGRLHCATDVASYAEQMLAVTAAEPLLVNRHPGFAPRPPWRPVTRFEQAGLDRGHPVVDLIVERRPATGPEPPGPVTGTSRLNP